MIKAGWRGSAYIKAMVFGAQVLGPRHNVLQRGRECFRTRQRLKRTQEVSRCVQGHGRKRFRGG
jgi:hypothetical protein